MKKKFGSVKCLIGFSVMHVPVSYNGGIRMIDFDIMLKALKHTWIPRLLRTQRIVIGVSFQSTISNEWED